MRPTRSWPDVPPLRALIRRRPHLSWAQALALVAGVSGTAVATGAVLVLHTDPGRFPNLGTACGGRSRQ
jgi:hypothetical protein